MGKQAQALLGAGQLAFERGEEDVAARLFERANNLLDKMAERYKEHDRVSAEYAQTIIAYAGEMNVTVEEAVNRFGNLQQNMYELRRDIVRINAILKRSGTAKR